MNDLFLPTEANGADLERRFGGLRRLYGDAGYARVRGARVAVVGLGGVGSWAVEALARSGVRSLVLVDLDHVSESNINRQIQALTSTLGLAKADALRRRIADIHPGCAVQVVDDFASASNWPALLGNEPIDALIDACDQGHAKLALAAWARASQTPLVTVGAAGGKQAAQRVEVADLAEATHDPLLAALRQRLRRDGAPRHGVIGLRCVFSREPVALPAATVDACAVGEIGEGSVPASASDKVKPEPSTDGSLNCHGYGSSVTVTATFGLVAAGELLRLLMANASVRAAPPGQGRLAK